MRSTIRLNEGPFLILILMLEYAVIFSFDAFSTLFLYFIVPWLRTNLYPSSGSYNFNILKTWKIRMQKTTVVGDVFCGKALWTPVSLRRIYLDVHTDNIWMYILYVYCISAFENIMIII